MTPNAFQSKSSKSLAWIQDPFLETWLLFSKIEHFLSWIPQSKKVSTPWKIPSKPVADLWNLGWLIQKDRRMWRAPICIIYQLCLFWTKTQKRYFYKVFEPHKRTTGSLKAFGSIAKKSVAPPKHQFFYFSVGPIYQDIFTKAAQTETKEIKGITDFPPILL